MDAVATAPTLEEMAQQMLARLDACTVIRPVERDGVLVCENDGFQVITFTGGSFRHMHDEIAAFRAIVAGRNFPRPVLLPVNVQRDEDAAVGAAYRRAAALLPPGWHIRIQDGRYGPGDVGPAAVEACDWIGIVPAVQAGGSTVAEALEALVVELEERKAAGE